MKPTMSRRVLHTDDLIAWKQVMCAGTEHKNQRECTYNESVIHVGGFCDGCPYSVMGNGPWTMTG